MRTSRARLRRMLEYQLAHPAEHREAQARYERTVGGRATHKRYYATPRGRRLNTANKRKQRAVASIMVAVKKWLMSQTGPSAAHGLRRRARSGDYGRAGRGRIHED
jgi:hypothetical protein